MFRPHFLFPLFGKLENLKGIGPKSIFNLHKLGILKPLDFLYSFPSSLKIRKHLEIISDFNENETVILKIRVVKHNFKIFSIYPFASNKKFKNYQECNSTNKHY